MVVRESDQVAELFARAEQAYGALDILMNNALCATQHVMDNDWQPQIDVIVKGTYECSLAAIERMQPNGRGSIVNISSVNGLFGLQGIHVYSAAKGAILALTKSMAVEQGKHGIRVNAIAPGLTDTAQPRDGMSEDEIRDAAALTPLAGLSMPDDIADRAVFLGADAAKRITGQTMHVNGGLYLY